MGAASSMQLSPYPFLMTVALAGCDPTVVFDAAPAAIDPGDGTTLTWDVTPNGSTTITSVTIEPGIGSVAASGSAEVAPLETTAYTLTAVAINGSGKEYVVTSEATVAVSDPVTCGSDDVTGIPATGSATFDTTGDFVPLCSGWLYRADQAASTR